MKCPRCNYVSHDYLDACQSCGNDVSAFKAQIGLYAQPPGVVPDLSAGAARRLSPAASDVPMTTPGTDTDATDTSLPTLEFIEIENEPDGGAGA